MNPTCVGLIGNGVVVHLPSFFQELDALQAQGLDCTNRLFISDRAQLVFDFHQIVDGLKEVELGGSRCVSMRFLCEGLTLIVFGVALGPQRRGLAPRTLGRLPDLVFESTTSSTMDPLRTSSVNWSRGGTNDTDTLNTTPKGRSSDTRSVQNAPRFTLRSDVSSV